MIPHLHTDAGWYLTFDLYYHGRAKRILNSMYKYLSTKYNVENREIPDVQGNEGVGNLPLSEEQTVRDEYLPG